MKQKNGKKITCILCVLMIFIGAFLMEKVIHFFNYKDASMVYVLAFLFSFYACFEILIADHQKK